MWAFYIEKHLDDARAWMSRGALLEQSRSKAKATHCFQKATKYAPNDSWIWNRYACHLWEVRGKPDDAIQAFAQWKLLESSSLPEHSNYAEFCIAESDFYEAHKYLESAWTKRKPGSWHGHLHFCAALYALRQNEPDKEAKQLRRIAWGLEKGMREEGSTFDALLKRMTPHLSEQDNRFYATLADALQNEPLSHLRLLNSPKWKEIKPEKPIGALF